MLTTIILVMFILINDGSSSQDFIFVERPSSQVSRTSLSPWKPSMEMFGLTSVVPVVES